MVFLEYLALSVVAMGALLLAWLAYLFCNMHLVKMGGGIVQNVLGTAVTIVLLAAVGLILNAFALDLTVGLLTAIGVFLVLTVIKGLRKQQARDASLSTQK